MLQITRQIATLAVGSVLLVAPALGAQASPQNDPNAAPSTSPSQSTTTQQTQNSQQSAPATQQPGTPPPDKNNPPTAAPVQQQDTVNPKNSKDDVDAIGNRNVSGKVNFYSLEREIALGKQLSQEVERSSKLIDDPVVTEYVNRVGQNLVRNSD